MEIEGSLQKIPSKFVCVYGKGVFEHKIIGSKTWVHHCTPEAKKDSMIWKRPYSPHAEKLKV